MGFYEFKVIFFNAKDFKKNTVIFVNDGVWFDRKSYSEIMDKCSNGPVFGFFPDDQNTLFRMRGTYYGIKRNHLLGEFWVIDRVEFEIPPDWKTEIERLSVEHQNQKELEIVLV